jgi:type III pantothenate kinase
MENLTFDFVVIDAGNSRIKLAYFLRNKIVFSDAFDTTDLEKWNHASKLFANIPCVLSSVLSQVNTETLINSLKNVRVIDPTKMVFKNSYKTFDTLGADRKANAVFLLAQKKTPALSIDIGTCVKFDFVNDQNSYEGGSISPGIAMRFKALNEFTGKLPLVTFEADQGLVGNSTKKAMLSGVINGIEAEINGMIDRYLVNFPNLTIFITGGDADKVIIRKENCIFAKFLTIEGLYLFNKLNA